MMKMLQTLLLVTFALFSVAASAQWQWIDKDGRKVFSDRAPPAEILDKNIVKRPQGRTASTTQPEAASEPVDAPSTSSTAAPPVAAAKGTGIDKELEAKKKQAADAELAKKKTEEDRILKVRIENCARAKQAKSSFDSGIRISRTNESGEKIVLDDAARAEEVKRIQSVINADCR
jgi:hypothetical protein